MNMTLRQINMANQENMFSFNKTEIYT